MIKNNISKNQNLIANQLSDLPITVTWLKQVDSTNTYAKQHFQAQQYQSIILAGSDVQTHGYGKQKRYFISNSGGVYLSLIAKVPHLTTSNQGLLTTGTAWCLHQTIRQQFNTISDIKWVNDLLLHGKKIAGILIEKIATQTVIIGIGCNLYQPNLEQALASSTNVLDYPPTTEQFCKFVAQLVRKLMSFIPNFTQEQFLYDYEKNMSILGQKVTAITGKKAITGDAVRLDNQANLILNNHGQLVTINSGEVLKIRQ